MRRQELNSTKLRGSTARTILPLVATGAGFIAIVSLALENWTMRFLSKAAGVPFFLSASIGFGALVITALVLRDQPKRAIVPGLFACIYWIAFFVLL